MLSQLSRRSLVLTLTGLAVAVATVIAVFVNPFGGGSQPPPRRLSYQPRKPVDTSGSLSLTDLIPSTISWGSSASLKEIGDAWDSVGPVGRNMLDQSRVQNLPPDKQVQLGVLKASMLHYDGMAVQAYQVLEEARVVAESNEALAEDWLFTLIYFQGITALRRAENDNCIMCRGETSCIIPISPAAIHTNPLGSRLAIKHFTEYLDQFPDDLHVRWLLNLAHMTLGEYPAAVDPRYLVRLDRFLNSEFDIGKFRDIGHLTGINRLNQAGGAIMDDFDNDGYLDLVTTSWEGSRVMTYFRNMGNGKFENQTDEAKLSGQLGGLNCVQTDYNNDGNLDIFIVRGAWFIHPMPTSLLRNNGDGTFTDVTEEAGLYDPVNSISATWGDFDNDGFVDLFICCEKQKNRLYRNLRDGTFEEVASRAGVAGEATNHCKGAAWVDFDNDHYPDLFVNNLSGTAQLFRNNRNGTFQDVTAEMNIAGPRKGFSCWAWDFDNDGWLDIFATSYDRTVEDVVRGMIGEPHALNSNRLYRNLQGKGFQDVTKEAGLDLVFGTMGSNFADFDNDGYLDFYLGTGYPNLATLVPNRMFKNVEGRRFADISVSAGVAHLQKGHGVACGDWDRDGDVDLFIEMGGATNGDEYHNILFQNPGQGNNWLTLKLVGDKTNRAAIGARIKAIVSGDKPFTIHRHITSGSSFGANSLEQTLGLGKGQRVELLEITWPTSGTTQTFRDVAVNQAIEVTEFAKEYRTLKPTPIPQPK